MTILIRSIHKGNAGERIDKGRGTLTPDSPKMGQTSDSRSKRASFRTAMTVLTATELAKRRNHTTGHYNEVAFLPGYNITENEVASKTGHFQTDLHGNVNILLGGAMLSGVVMAVVLMCYCCHKNIRKNRPQEYSPYWRTEPDVHSLEVFTTDAHAVCFDRQPVAVVSQDENLYGALSCPVTPSSGPGPPPAYDSLIFDHRSLPTNVNKKVETPGSPGRIIPSTVSTLFGLATTPVQFAESNETAEQESADEGLPSYEAALRLDATGYV